MSASISQALAKLDNVVGKLEGSVNNLEDSLAGHQREMFVDAPSNENTNIRYVNSADVAEKLDKTIEKFEKILQEG